jgi:hypothetical protein
LHEQGKRWFLSGAKDMSEAETVVHEAGSKVQKFMLRQIATEKSGLAQNRSRNAN